MKAPNTLDFPLFTASLNEEGKWIYKSKDLKFKKKDGTLKAKYKDLPRIKVIYKIEDNLSKEYKSFLMDSMKEINDKLIHFSNA